MMKPMPSDIRSPLHRPSLAGAIFLAILLLPVCSFGQALPAAEAAPISTGFTLPTTLGSLHYALRASETLTWGYYGNSGVAAATNVGGDLGYISNSRQYPFTVVVSGGHSWATANEPSFSYVNLGFSQQANVGRWELVISDNVSYMPSTPTTGLSGIPGAGDLGVSPIEVGLESGQGVLTDYSNRVSNIVAGSVLRQITGKTSLVGSGSYATTRFLDNTVASGDSSSAGLDSDSITGSGGLKHQFDARNTLAGNYVYTQYDYTGNNFGVPTPGFDSQIASLQYTHLFTRKLTVTAAAGPEWTTIDTPGSSAVSSLFANAAVNYIGRYSHASATFVRSTNAGFGVFGGSLSDSVNVTVGRTFAAVWNVSASSAYTQTSSLPYVGALPYSLHTIIEAGQASRAVARSFSVYASYALQDQSNPGSVPTVDLFSGRSQVVGFGVTYSPNSVHLGRQ